MIVRCLIIAIFAFSATNGVLSCDRTQMRQCEDRLLRNIQRRVNDMNRQSMSDHCLTVRDDFNCLLKETRCLTSETDRNKYGDSLRNAIRYIRDGCDSIGGGWRDNTCFTGDPMKNCENAYPLGGVQFSSHNTEACRKFNLFQDCVLEAIRNRCRREDDRHLGQYMVDVAQDLAWNCGESSAFADLIRDQTRTGSSDDRYGDRYNDRYNDRNDRDRDRDRDWRTNSRDDRYRDGDRDRYSSTNRYYGSDNGNSDITCCRNERCDRNRMQRCRDSLSRTIDNRIAGYQDSTKCIKARDDFNCLLWHTSTCVSRDERDRVNDIFRRARDYISRNCDSYGRWSEKSCYKSTEMQRCENFLSNTRGGANYEACRAYNSFRDCMTNELERRCTRDDDLYQGAYLVDKAQEMSWQCGTTDSGGRNGHFDGRDRYDNPQYSPYDDNPPHLEDEDAMCLSRASSWTDGCKNTLDEKRRQLFTENDYDVRQRITCCSAREYKRCLEEAVERVCQTPRRRVVNSLLGRFRYEIDSDSCRGIYDCSAASLTYGSVALLSICIALLSALFTVHL